MSLGRLSVVAVLLVLSAAGPARAATTIGSLAPNASSLVTDRQYVQVDDGSGPSYAVPAGGGVITSLSERAFLSTAHATGEVNRVMVFRGATPSFTVVGSADVTVLTTSAANYTVPTRIPVAAGDRLGAFSSSASNVTVVAILGAPAVSRYVSTTTSTPDGGTATMPTGSANTPLIAATVEADADHDGYGDDTQDSCPSLAGIHTGSCTVDLRSSATTTPGTIAAGDVATVNVSVTNAGPAIALHARATLTIPDGLSVISASTTGGECVATTCDLGDIPSGTTRKIALVVRATIAGTYAVGVHPQADNPELSTADDSTTAALVANAPLASTLLPNTPTPTPITPVATVKLCTVPSLKGKTASAAKVALTAAGCATGSTKGSKAKTAKVSTQTIPSKVVVVAGTKVGFTLVAAKAKKK